MRYRLVVNAAAGRMGRRIVAIAAQHADMQIAGAVEQKGHPDIGKDAGVVAGAGELGVAIGSEFPERADVLIDFSVPQALDAVIDYCCGKKSALVVGTTGLSEQQSQRLRETGKVIPVVYATNMSVGMNAMFKLAPLIAGMLGPGYDIEIVEAHHRFKKDAPSGSALTLAENIARETAKSFPDCLVHGRVGKECLRKEGTIGMHAVRAGDITGRHTVIFGTAGETITIEHNAHNRDTFAAGAVRAARWVAGRKAGLYSMADVLSTD